MRPIRHSLAFLIAFLLGCAVQASPLPSVSFNHNDWEIACDNTRTCRAAAYAEDDEQGPVSILLTRQAGPAQAVKAQLQIGHYNDDVTALPSTVQMTVDGRAAGDVKLDKNEIGTLTPVQTATLLSAVLKDTDIRWTGGQRSWRLSTKGANAVLLKMDEFQGRLDTPGALVRKGDKPESVVLPALPVPEISAPDVQSSQPDPHLVPTPLQPKLIEALRKTGDTDSCDQFPDAAKGTDELSIYRLSAHKLLVSGKCWLAAYNAGSGYWVVNDAPPYAPVLVTIDGTGYGKDTISANRKGRGLGDCWLRWEWTWDGKRFVQTAESTTGLCRLIAPGGAWRLPTLVTKVSKTK